MVDLQETPATPPMDPGGDERTGLFIAGALLVALGWGFGVAINVGLHLAAGARGLALGWFRIYPALGAFAWAALAFGVFSGVVGVVLIALGRATARGPLVLPGYPY